MKKIVICIIMMIVLTACADTESKSVESQADNTKDLSYYNKHKDVLTTLFGEHRVSVWWNDSFTITYTDVMSGEEYSFYSERNRRGDHLSTYLQSHVGERLESETSCWTEMFSERENSESYLYASCSAKFNNSIYDNKYPLSQRLIDNGVDFSRFDVDCLNACGFQIVNTVNYRIVNGNDYGGRPEEVIQQCMDMANHFTEETKLYALVIILIKDIDTVDQQNTYAIDARLKFDSEAGRYDFIKYVKKVKNRVEDIDFSTFPYPKI